MSQPLTAKRILLLTLFLLTTSTLAFGQSNKATIVGSAKDPNDALVTGAKITVTNNATGVVRETESDSEGAFTVTNLEPGAYKVSAEASGFQTVNFENVQLETNARLPLDVKFTTITGGAGTVTISADTAPLTESETSVRGDVITGRQVTDLPIPQRNFTLLAALSPGVTRPNLGLLGGGGNFVSGGGGQNNTESTRFRESGGSVLVINGARATNNNFRLDGVDNNESQFGQIAIYPQPDFVSEFKVESSVPTAESGRAGGGVISVTTKSGGNEVHGTIGEVYQGRFLSAAAARFDDNPANIVNGRPRQSPNYVTHNYFGTVGGPIFLPRFQEGGSPVWDGRNRSFFFFSLNGQRNSTPIFGGGENPSNVPVPTAKMRVGDFSELLRPGTSRNYQLAGGGTVTAPIGTIFAPNGTPIPGNDLRNCPTCGSFSPFAQTYLNAFPFPNLPGAGRNYSTNRKERANVDSYDIRIDHRISDNNSLFGRYSKSKSARSRDNFFLLGTSPTNNDLPAGPSAGDEFGNARGFTLGDTHTFSPTIINDARFGFNRVRIGIFNTGVNGTGGFAADISARLGARNINLGPSTSGITLIGIVDELVPGSDRGNEFTGDGGPFYFLSNNFNFVDSLTVVRGSHTFKGGGDYRVRQNSNFDGGRNGGTKGNTQYGTTGSGFVSGNYNGIGPNDTGSSLANFLLGYRPGFVTRGDPGGPYFLSSKEIAFFVQDDWKARSDLTLNLGLRYDVFTAPTERFDRLSNFEIPTKTVVMAGDDAPGGRDLATTDKNNFGPRIGFAYSGLRSDNRFVIRGGYGILYATDISAAQPLSANPGTGAASYSCTPITNPGGCAFPVLVGRNLFDVGLPLAPVTVAPPGTRFAAPTSGGLILFNDPNRSDEYFHQYNLTAQYEFAANWLAEVAYVGSLGRNLLVLQNIGTGNDQGGPGSREIVLVSPGSNNPVTATRYRAKSRYDAFQSKLERRFTRGLSLLSTYTWSHAIDDSPGGICTSGASARDCGPDDPLRPELERGNSDTDVRHRFTLASVYDLPFGRGRRFGSSMPRALDFVVGGFQLNNIITVQSGPVFNVTCDSGRVDLIGDPSPTASDEAQGRQLNRAAFRCATQKVFAGDPDFFPSGAKSPRIGSLGRNVFRGRKQFYWDASLFKNFAIPAISDEFNVQLRFSAYNVLNRVNRSFPTGDFNNTNDFGKDLSEQRRRQLEFSLKLIF